MSRQIQPVALVLLLPAHLLEELAVVQPMPGRLTLQTAADVYRQQMSACA
jgi:hypothetical protein